MSLYATALIHDTQQPAWGRSREFEITTRSSGRMGLTTSTTGDLDDDEEEEEEEDTLVHGRRKRKVAFMPSVDTNFCSCATDERLAPAMRLCDAGFRALQSLFPPSYHFPPRLLGFAGLMTLLDDKLISRFGVKVSVLALPRTRKPSHLRPLCRILWTTTTLVSHGKWLIWTTSVVATRCISPHP
ncbi:hypothetical protein BDZ89DRAFT_725175 [Hymenopellis radicata]|nr:hypothetical protein BDZ89DRAFT_725175 [Hymenopellis radicata]